MAAVLDEYGFGIAARRPGADRRLAIPLLPRGVATLKTEGVRFGEVIER